MLGSSEGSEKPTWDENGKKSAINDYIILYVCTPVEKNFKKTLHIFLEFSPL